MLRLSFVFLLLMLPVMGKKPNVLLICVDDLRPELKSFGVDYVHSPAIDSLAASGRGFKRHYVQAPTCGASRYALLTGKYGSTPKLRNNDAIMSVADQAETEPFSLPKQFRQNGYQTVSIGKVSHYVGGLGGKDWADPQKVEMPGAWDLSMMPVGPWETPQKSMHGLANGQHRVSGATPVNQHKEGDDFTYMDGWISREAISQMEALAGKEKPFFLAVGLLKPHLPFGCPKSYRDLYNDVKLPPIPYPEKPKGLSTWHASGEFFGQYESDDPRTDPACADEMRKSYLACVSYTDAQVAKLLKKLDELKLSENTIVVLWGDHGWHLGEHNVWGKHTLFEESLRSPLIIRYPGMEKSGAMSDAVVETVDIFPTLCELADVTVPKSLSGQSLVPQLKNPNTEGDIAMSFWTGAETIRTAQYRLVRHSKNKDGAAYELYDHVADAGEIKNIANEKPEIVKELSALMDQKMK